MRISDNLTDDAVLEEIGARVLHQRINLNLKQDELAKKAGIGKRTLERIEAGESSQAISLIRVLRALGLLSALDDLLPDTRPGPIEILRSQKTKNIRKRVSGKNEPAQDEEWTWGDDS